MLNKGRIFFQLLFLFVFAAAVISGNIQIWMIIFLASLGLAFILGRFFCGYICPISTFIEVVDRIYKKLGLKRKSEFGWLKNPVLKYAFLITFLALLLFFMVSGKKIPLLPILTILGVLVSLLFLPALWHRYICPFGTILSLPGHFSKFHLKVDNEQCNKCNKCKKICPAEAVIIENKGDYPAINKTYCLECLACYKECPKKAIFFG